MLGRQVEGLEEVGSRALDGENPPERLLPPFPTGPSSPLASSQSLPLLPGRPSKGEGSGSGGGTDAGERCAGGRPVSHTRFLQPTLPRGESHGRLEAGDRPFSPESVCLPDSVPHGDSSFSLGSCSSRGLHGIHHPVGCLLSSPHSPLVEEVSSFSIILWSRQSFIWRPSRPVSYTHLTLPTKA